MQVETIFKKQSLFVHEENEMSPKCRNLIDRGVFSSTKYGNLSGSLLNLEFFSLGFPLYVF